MIFAWFLVTYSNNETFRDRINVNVETAQIFLQREVNSLMGNKTAETQTSTTQATSEADVQNARWNKKSATVYIDITDPTLQAAANTAINRWNATGAFSFKKTNDKSKANIVITTMNKQSNGAAGLTNTKINAVTGYLMHATVRLNTAYLLNAAYGYSQERIVNTAEHELGHAIGLSHTNEVSVMQPAGSYYSIQQLDINNVKSLYATKPSVSSSNDGQSGTNQNFQ
ncbi:MAG: matrixin family metalloprotease [Limosilactobacillus sp.]|uniref:matrixin family metalloprotease n=1 Tax=Limosilactobacillus sp. TaxID=2773925 RepID=UPI00270F4320|nr:matrixin family metalloprotease [Limosilactobacillus sp.]